MSIHQEKAKVDIKDSQLLKKMLSYALPHWKMITLCIFLAFLIVTADLVRPYLLKIAIDDNINGLHKPMYAVEAGKGEQLEPYGKPIVIDGTAYVRVQPEDREIPAADMRKTQIVEVEQQSYLIDGWPDSRAQFNVQTTSGSAVQLVQTDNGVLYTAQAIDEDTVSAFRARDFGGLLFLGIFFLIAIIGGSLLNYVQSNLLQYTGQHIIYRIRSQLFEHLSRMSASFFDRNPVGRLVVRVTQDTETLNQLYSQVIVNMVKDIIVLIGIFVIMIQLNFKLAALMMVVIPL
ncbi:MAG: transporter, partial [Paenibacillus sp.]|nr:transporter [Paenibacillus sp.]